MFSNAIKFAVKKSPSFLDKKQSESRNVLANLPYESSELFSLLWHLTGRTPSSPSALFHIGI